MKFIFVRHGKDDDNYRGGINMDMRKYRGKWHTTELISPEANIRDYIDLELWRFFPKEENWGHECFNKPKALNMEYLPCNLDNDKWLAKMLVLFCDFPSSAYKEVLHYVKTSNNFKAARHEYALRIVKWQINFIKNNDEFYHLKPEHGTELWKMSGDCDKAFRWAVIDTLQDIGMDPVVIEEGLEKYASEWRDEYMEQAFNNRFYPLGTENRKIENKELGVIDGFKEAWLATRKYNYFQEHRDYILLFGSLDPAMKISTEEYNTLKDFVFQEEVKRGIIPEKMIPAKSSKPNALQRIRTKIANRENRNN